MEEVGYNNYYAVLNAKDYGIPQNRERVFIISIRKDIDKGFTFPQAMPLKLRLNDLLEDQVDDSYYLSDDIVSKLVLTVVTSDSPKIEQVGQIYSDTVNPQSGRIYNPSGLSPTLDTCTGGNRMVKIVENLTEDEIEEFLNE